MYIWTQLPWKPVSQQNGKNPYSKNYTSYALKENGLLLSLIGKLSFSCKVLQASRIFLRRLIDLSTTVTKLHHHLCLTTEAKLDLQWWLSFLIHWSGRALILDSCWTDSATMQLYTDASGTEGWGAYWSGKWICDHWLPEQQELSIAWKELYTITVAAHTWSTFWKCQNYSSIVITLP